MSGIPTAQDYEGSGDEAAPSSMADLVNAWEKKRPAKVGRRSHTQCTLQGDTVSEEEESQLLLSAKSVLLGQITKNTQRGIERYVTVPQLQLNASEKSARFNFENSLRSAATGTFSEIIDALYTENPERLKLLAEEYPLVNGKKSWTINFSHKSASGETATVETASAEDDQGTLTYNVYVHSNGPPEFDGEECVVGVTTDDEITRFGLVSATSTA